MIETVLEAVKNQISAAAPNLKSCEIYDGELTDSLLDTLMSKGVPAVHVSFVGTGALSTDNDGRSIAELALMAFVLTRPYRTVGAREAATDLCELVSDMALNWTWGITEGGIQPGRDVRIDNLYSGEIEDEGVALYSVGWKQPVRWGTSKDTDMDMYPELTDGSSEYTYADFQNLDKWYAEDEEVTP